MISEAQLHYLFGYLPFTAVQLQHESGIKKWLKHGFRIELVSDVFLMGKAILCFKVVSILTFLCQLHSLLFLNSNIVYLLVLRKDTHPETSLNKLTAINSDVKGTRKSDLKLHLLVGYLLIMGTTYLFKFQYTAIWDALFDLQEIITIVHCTFVQFAFLKRIQILKNQRSELEEMVVKLRSWVGFILEINQAYSAQFSAWFVRFMTVFLWSMSAFWTVYGLHSEYDCMEFHAPVTALITQTQVMALGMVLAWSCTQVQHSVSTQIK